MVFIIVPSLLNKGIFKENELRKEKDEKKSDIVISDKGFFI